MKKLLRLIVICGVLFSLLIPNLAFAEESAAPEWEDVQMSESEIDEMLSDSYKLGGSKGLIVQYAIAISKNGNILNIAGKTLGSSKVVKCGFKKVIIQRRPKKGGSWSDYKTYKDMYKDGRGYTFAKSVKVSSGYQYRVYCTHYAKKNLLSTEKINNTSNVLTF